MNTECNVCFELVRSSSNENPYATPCGHIFHENCIQNYIEKHQRCKCPKCNKDIKRGALIRLYISEPDAAVNARNKLIVQLQHQLHNITAQIRHKLLANVNCDQPKRKRNKKNDKVIEEIDEHLKYFDLPVAKRNIFFPTDSQSLEALGSKNNFENVLNEKRPKFSLASTFGSTPTLGSPFTSTPESTFPNLQLPNELSRNVTTATTNTTVNSPSIFGGSQKSYVFGAPNTYDKPAASNQNTPAVSFQNASSANVASRKLRHRPATESEAFQKFSFRSAASEGNHLDTPTTSVQNTSTEKFGFPNVPLPLSTELSGDIVTTAANKTLNSPPLLTNTSSNSSSIFGSSQKSSNIFGSSTSVPKDSDTSAKKTDFPKFQLVLSEESSRKVVTTTAAEETLTSSSLSTNASTNSKMSIFGTLQKSSNIFGTAPPAASFQNTPSASAQYCVSAQNATPTCVQDINFASVQAQPSLSSMLTISETFHIFDNDTYDTSDDDVDVKEELSAPTANFLNSVFV